jgi:hypothetical protein
MSRNMPSVAIFHGMLRDMNLTAARMPVDNA